MKRKREGENVRVRVRVCVCVCACVFVYVWAREIESGSVYVQYVQEGECRRERESTSGVWVWVCVCVWERVICLHGAEMCGKVVEQGKKKDLADQQSTESWQPFTKSKPFLKSWWRSTSRIKNRFQKNFAKKLWHFFLFLKF